MALKTTKESRKYEKENKEVKEERRRLVYTTAGQV